MSYVQTPWGLRNVATGRWASLDDARKTVFMWHSMGDACPQCLNLNGREWYDQDVFQDVLWDATWGNLVDLTTGQKFTHGGTGINCRCDLEVRVELDVVEVEELTSFEELLGLMI